ncbi:MAG: hypothetical protein OXJ90_04160 [Spirochaetaceae bacterium]|nr:hypothetical protein [Spirochaetaceae bacterium]
MVGDHGHDRIVGDGLVVEQLQAVTGDQNLRVLRRVPEAVDEDLGSRRVKRDFGLFYAHESAVGSSVPGTLEQGHEHAERTQRAVGHVVGKESPGVLRAPNLLPEFESLSRANQPPPDAGDARHDLPRYASMRSMNSGGRLARTLATLLPSRFRRSLGSGDWRSRITSGFRL